MSFARRLRLRASIVLTVVVCLSIAIPATVFAVTAFKDVAKSSGYYADIQAAVGAKVMTSCKAGKFCPKAYVTREQLARVVNRLGALGAGRTPVVHAATALTAASAANAAHATNADHATSADHATTADSATSADHATTADSATTATSAGSAANASHAASADVATSATNADSAASAADADLLDGIDSTGFVRPTGQILIAAGNGNWKRFSDSDATTAVYFSSTTQWTVPTAGSRFLSVSPDLPVSIFGKAVEFQGVQFCYGNAPGTSLNYVEINTVSSVAGESSRHLRLSDATTRTDSACRIYTLPTPILLGPSDGANIFVQVNWSVVGAAFSINRTTFILAATNTPAAAPAGVPTQGRPGKANATSPTDVSAR